MNALRRSLCVRKSHSTVMLLLAATVGIGFAYPSAGAPLRGSDQNPRSPAHVRMATVSSVAPSYYRLIDLGTVPSLPTYVFSDALALNDLGQVVGHVRQVDPYYSHRGFVFADENGNGQADAGEMVALDTLGGPDSRAYGINNLGWVVGYAMLDERLREDGTGWPSHTIRPCLWRDGQTINLGVLPEFNAWNQGHATDVNDAGRVVGYLIVGSSNGFVWEGGVLSSIVVPLGEYTAGAWRVNELGVVVGSSDGVGELPVHDRRRLATVWPQNPTTEPGIVVGAHFVPPPLDTMYSQGRDINDQGQVVGSSQNIHAPGSEKRPFVLTPRDGLWYVDDDGDWFNDLIIPLDSNNLPGEASAINEQGLIVGGVLGVEFGNYRDMRATLWVDGFRHDLGSLLHPDFADWTLITANDINELGQIVGKGVNPAGEEHAYLLTPFEGDCNFNGIPDEDDVASGTSADCNANLVPDECEPDCNTNGTADECDLTAGTSIDCNVNGIPDECEPDCNVNTVPDDCDIASGTSEDCSDNGVPDECEVDCNANGSADSCDLADGTSADCNSSASPDECDIADGSSIDCNGNGVPDTCDLASGTSIDCNENDVPDACDVANGIADCDGNGIPDTCERVDCNSNGQLDTCDVASGASGDANGNGVPDECDGRGIALVPVSADGVHTIDGRTIRLEEAGRRVTFEIRISGWDFDLDGEPRLAGWQVQLDSSGFTSGTSGELTMPFIEIPCAEDAECPGYSSECVQGVCEDNAAFYTDVAHPDFVFLGLETITAVNVINVDPVIGMVLWDRTDSVADTPGDYYGGTVVLDLSGNATGTFTVGFTGDADQSLYIDSSNKNVTIPTFMSATIAVFPDCNDNGVIDTEELAGGDATDCNGNGLPDECDLADGTSADCNGNNTLDQCDIADGSSSDGNSNGVPDECEAFYGYGVALVPVSASGPHAIDGQTIRLDEGGHSVKFEIRISGWDLNRDGTQLLETYQAQIDSGGFTSGYAGSLSLALIEIPCSSGSDCPGYNSDCIQGVCSDNGAFFVDESHPDYVFSEFDTVTGANIVDENPFLGATLWNASDCVAETLQDRYAGTLVLDVSADAVGDFTIGLLPEGSLYSGCTGEHLPIPALLPARVEVIVDCNGNGVLDPIDIAEGTSLDQDGNGVPDECDIMPGATAEGARFLRTTMTDAVDQEAQIIVRCAGGMERYVDHPTGDATNMALLTEDAASAPYLSPAEWKSPLHITGMSVAPGRTYTVFIELADGTRSAPVTVTTAIWGDVVGTAMGSAPDNLVNFRDISAVVLCFMSDVKAPPKVRCDLDPAIPNGVIDFHDIARAVEAFVDREYPYATVADCVEP